MSRRKRGLRGWRAPYASYFAKQIIRGSLSGVDPTGPDYETQIRRITGFYPTGWLMLAYAIMNEDMKSADHVMRKFGITTPMKQWDHPHPRKGLPQRPKFHWPHLEARFLKVS